jgi:hypothetical protein
MIVNLDNLLQFIESFSVFAVLRGLEQHNNTSGSFSLRGSTEFFSGFHIDIGDFLLLAEDGNVADDINGADISSKDANSKKIK